MWWAILTRRELQFKKELETKLQAQIKQAQIQKGQEKLDAQNASIRKINKLNIEYKYEKATKSMIHDWGKSQVMSMLWALRYVWILE